MLAVGPRIDEAGYSRDEKTTLTGLAEQAGTALYVARLNEEKQAEEQRTQAAEAANRAKTAFLCRDESRDPDAPERGHPA